MAFERRYTARQVAEAVLKTTQELLAKSELHKKYEGFKAVEESARESGASDPAAVAAAVGRKKYGKHAFQEAAAHGHKMGKSDDLDKCGTFSKVHEKAKREGYSEESADKIAGHAKAIEKSEMKAKLIKEGLSPNEVEARLKKYETENSKKLGYKLPEAGRNENQPEKSDKAFEVQPQAPKNALGPESPASGKNDPMPEIQKSEDPRLNRQTPPGNNPKEQAEGNNELAGTTPTQVGQDGKNVPGGDEIRGHLKLAKFIGRMEHKRSLSKKMPVV